MSNERTRPNYPTFGPEDGTGRDWRQFFKEVKHGSDSVPDADADDDLSEPESGVTITIPGTEVQGGWPSVITTWRNRLLANDWLVKVGHAQSNWPTTYAKNGNVKKAEHVIDSWWINAAKPGRYITIYYEYSNGKSVRVSRSIRGQWALASDAEMRDAIEAEDD